MFFCKLYKVIFKLLISVIFVFISLTKVSAEPPKPYKFDYYKMKLCIESNQITIRDRKNNDIVYGIPVKFKNLDNGTVEYEFNICIDNKFWVGNCNLPYIEKGENKEINGFEVKIRNHEMIRNIRFVNGEFRTDGNLVSPYSLVCRCSYQELNGEFTFDKCGVFENLVLNSVAKGCYSLETHVQEVCINSAIAYCLVSSVLRFEYIEF